MPDHKFQPSQPRMTQLKWKFSHLINMVWRRGEACLAPTGAYKSFRKLRLSVKSNEPRVSYHPSQSNQWKRDYAWSSAGTVINPITSLCRCDAAKRWRERPPGAIQAR